MEEIKKTPTINVLELHREKYERRLRLHKWFKGLSVEDMLIRANAPKDVKPYRAPTIKKDNRPF